jgi:cysteinyl-tRNA synthetase
VGTISTSVEISDDQIDLLIAQRLAARKVKNWAESDRIRDELKAQGIILEDRPDGTTDWRRS